MPGRYKRTLSTKNLQAEVIRRRFNNHTGLSMRTNPIYRIYLSMLQKCGNPKATDYLRHGGRGIKVCERWMEPSGQGFRNFLEDIGERPSGVYPRTGMSLYILSRRDLGGNYTPENCHWSTRIESSVRQAMLFIEPIHQVLLSHDQFESPERERIAWKLSGRFGWFCWYCGISLKPISTQSQRQKRKHASMIVRELETHLDHVVPRAAGGSDDISNLALSCEICNRGKFNLNVDFFLEWIDRVKFGDAWIPIKDGRRSSVRMAD